MRDTPFEPLDDGVAIGEHSPRQDVPHSPKTEMLPIQGMPPSYPPHGQYVAEPAQGQEQEHDDQPEEDDEDSAKNTRTFRRHLREPLLRILPTRYSPKWYRVLLAFGLLVLVAAAGVYMANGQNMVLMAGCAVAVMLFAYPTLRETYRWRHRLVILQRTETGIRITYREPSCIWLGFNGDGDGNVTILEGSTEFNSRINWPNRLVFWGCGDLLIAGKVEAGGSPLLENVPNIKQVREFLSQAA